MSSTDLPSPAELPVRSEWPDPLAMLDGRRIASREMWERERKPELHALFQHYMYGRMPAAPKVKATVRRTDPKALGGKATLKEVSLAYGPEGCPPLELLLVIPNKNSKPVPIFLGLNFTGNHTLLPDPEIKIPTAWMRQREGVEDHRATPNGRGLNVDSWALEQSIDAGFAVATFYYGDGLPDKPDYTDGSYPYFVKVDGAQLGLSDCGAIAYWAWTLHRAVDYLVTVPEIDRERIAVFGHSRNGKAALVAAAFDERIALAVPHQSGCCGAAPSRTANPKAETVKKINDSFPHWFCGNFKAFNEEPARLPFDQHALVALCAPRPVLFTNGLEDQWCDPPGQFEILKAATPVYALYGSEGLAAPEPKLGELVSSPLGYYLREGVHVTDPGYWRIFTEFAAKRLKPRVS